MKVSKKSMNSAFALRTHLPQILVDQGREDDRLAAAVRRLALDAREAFLGLLHAVDEGQGDLLELDAFELASAGCGRASAR